MRSCSGVEGQPTRLRAETHKLRAQTNETRLVFLQPLVDAYVEYSGCYSSFLPPAVFVLPSLVPSFPPPHTSFCHPCRRGLLPTAAPLQSAHLLNRAPPTLVHIQTPLSAHRPRQGPYCSISIHILHHRLPFYFSTRQPRSFPLHTAPLFLFLPTFLPFHPFHHITQPDTTRRTALTPCTNPPLPAYSVAHVFEHSHLLRAMPFTWMEEPMPLLK